MREPAGFFSMLMRERRGSLSRMHFCQLQKGVFSGD
jgi:hypothetical protein